MRSDLPSHVRADPWLLRFLARNKHRRPFRVASSLAGEIHHRLNWADHDPRTNGERRLLAAFGSDASEIFDVGAHDGGWAAHALDACPMARVHCIDVSHYARQRLQLLADEAERLIVAPRGFGAASGVIPIKRYPHAPHLASQFDYPHPFDYDWLEEAVETGDEYLRRLDINCVDLVKLDVEGAEHLILRGFQAAFERGAIRAVQFEYGRINILSRFLLRDFYRFFEARGFRVGRVQANGIAFRTYVLADENFFGANFLAVRIDDPALMHRLQRDSR